MFVRTTSRRNKDGTVVRYLQLAHNEWDPAAKSARMKVLYNFGRAEELDRAAVQRLIGSLSRLLGETSRGSQVEDQAGGLPGLALHRVPAAGRGLGAGRVVDPARDRQDDAHPAERDPPRRHR